MLINRNSTGFFDTACNGTICNIMETSWDLTCTLIWIVGVLSNLLNILIFSHKSMLNPTNSILWWLAVSDLIQLLVIALYGWCCGWCPYIDLIFPGPFETSFNVSVLFLSSIYLLQVFHSITIGLNVILAYWRYLAVMDNPFHMGKFRSDNRTVGKIVFFQYVLSFLTASLVFYSLKIHKVSFLKGITKNLYVVFYRPTEMTQDDSYEIQDDFFVEVCTITYGLILRVVPLVILTAISAKLIFLMSRARRARRQISASGITETHRQMDRINIMVAGILFTFVIVEIPFAMCGVLRVLHYLINLPRILISIMKILRYVQKIALLISSSCNIFYYLIISTQYRETMKLLLYNVKNNRPLYSLGNETTFPSLELRGNL